MLAGFVFLPGCAMTFPTTSLFERRNTPPPAPAPTQQTAPAAADPTIVTGSTRAGAPAGVVAPLPAEDWAHAEKALREALADRADTPSVSWENPANGARGTMTALQRAAGQGSIVCRAFLGSSIKERAETWFEGRACRLGEGAWTFTEMRPWRRG